MINTKPNTLVSGKVLYCGHIVSSDGVMAHPSMVNAVQSWPTPSTIKEVMGLVSYYRPFICNFADIARPLYCLTWRAVRSNSWVSVIICNTKKGIVISANILSQIDIKQVITCASRTLSKAKHQYCVTRRELLAVITFTKHFRPCLLGHQFTLRSDHGSLVWFKDPQGQLAHWLQQLEEFHFKIVHHKGRQHSNADALSHIPVQLT